MKTSQEWFDKWFDTDPPTQNIVELLSNVQKEAYIQGYNDATKGDDPLYDDGLGS